MCSRLLNWSNIVSITRKTQLPVSQHGRKFCSAPPAPTVSRFPGFTPVFVSPHIKHIRVACRPKLYQTCLVTGLLPYSLHLLQAGHLLPHQVGHVSGNHLEHQTTVP